MFALNVAPHVKRLPRHYTLGVRLTVDELKTAKRASKAVGANLSRFSREAVLDKAKAVLEPQSQPQEPTEAKA